MRNRTPREVEQRELETLIFRNMFIQSKDLEITDVLWNYFEAVKRRWPIAWDSTAKGKILNKTNGFKALMRFLRKVYLHICGPGEVPSTDAFSEIFKRITLEDNDFSIENFKPGTSGESSLYQSLLSKSGIES